MILIYRDCGALVTSGYCPTHQRKVEAQRGSSTQRHYDRRWRKFRSAVLFRRPLCEASCGCERPATELHHVIRLEDGGALFDEDNVQALCGPHHDSLGGKGGRV